MGGKGKGGAPPGGDAITWGPLARANNWGWDKEQPAAAPEAQPAAAPAQAAAQEQAAPAAAAPQGEPAPPQATDGAIQTTQDTGSKLAQSVTAPAMWTDQMKAQQGGGSMTTTGQV
jgi:hypothetical protein